MGAKKLCINGYVLTNSFFEKYLHIPLPIYEFILERIKSKIEKKDTHFRVPIAAGARLEATLLFLVTGRSYSRLQYLNRIEKNTLEKQLKNLLSSTIYQLMQLIKQV